LDKGSRCKKSFGKIIKWIRSRQGVLVTLCACFVILFTLSYFSYAKYYSNRTEEPNARLATFDVSDAFDGLSKECVISGESRSIKVTVTNNSEVAIIYSMTLENVTNNLDLVFTYPTNTTVALSAQDSDEPMESAQFKIPPRTVEVYEIGVSFNGAEDGLGDAEYGGRVDLIRLTVKAEQTL
jgi:hypothetical protein